MSPVMSWRRKLEGAHAGSMLVSHTGRLYHIMTLILIIVVSVVFGAIVAVVAVVAVVVSKQGKLICIRYVSLSSDMTVSLCIGYGDISV